MVVQAWEQAEFGKQAHGELWTISSDGDATRRRSLHKLLMCEDLSPLSPIHRLLSPLKLMNMRVGSHAMTLNFDTKYLFKRFATLVRGSEGIIVGHSHIQSAEIRRHLSNHPNFTGSVTTIATLFDGKDHQNVPKAVRLLSAVSSIRMIPDINLDPASRPIILLGHLLDSLLLPFITPELTLTDQLIHLSMAAHILLSLYHCNKTAFMPGQLYYDTQACIKNIYFCVAKQKVLDPDGKIFIGLCGTDRLEGEFGQIRSARGGSNVDLLQLSDRAASAAQISEIFARNPSWDRGHRRLSLTGKEGIDHTNPKLWIGDTTVKVVSLLTCWNTGKQKADTYLQAAGIKINFNELNLSMPVDMMRPQCTYVGLREDESDPSQINEAVDITSSASLENEGDTSPCELDDLLLDPATHDSPVEATTDLDSIFKKEDAWLKVGGRSIHKASAVRIALSEENVLKS